jgi:ribosome-binding factor A
VSHRREQVASVLMRELQRVLSAGLSDPRIAPLITVTKVELSRDLRSATVFVTAMPADKQKVTIHGLRAASKHIRHRISDNIALKRTPDLFFKLDGGAQNQAEVMRALAELTTEDDDMGDETRETRRHDDEPVDANTEIEH